MQGRRMLHLGTAGLLIGLERRGLLEVFPERVRKIWKATQLRALVLSSLILQVLLIISGKRRKYKGQIWFRFFIWSTYLLADWVATIGLGVIANNIQAVPNKGGPSGDDLMSFWAPFLLIHLGGPDTITAYSLEDNELWQRRTLELLTQTIASLYIFLIAWPGISSLSILTIPMLIVGVIKFGERIGSLRSASSEHFRDSLLTQPDPGPNYAKFMEDFTLKKAEGFYVKADVITEASALSSSLASNQPDSKLIVKAYSLFQRFKRLFVDLILTFQDRDESKHLFSKLGSEKAFHVIEVELGFIYDAFYTKAPVIYSPLGCALRLITMVLTTTVLIALPITTKGHHYRTVDLAITYILMGGAIVLEIIALISLLFSDWTRYWVSKNYNKSNDLSLGKRWSSSMVQYNLLDTCLAKKARFPMNVAQKLSTINNALEKHMRLTHEGVSCGLKTLIFEHCRDISDQIKDIESLMKLCRSRGDYTLNKYKVELNWSTAKVEFDRSILIWHIATDLCYYCDNGEGDPKGKGSKQISDYMLYLLAMRPFMLPVGIGLIRLRDTCAEAQEFFKNKMPISSKVSACKMLLRVNTEVLPADVKGDRSKSVLFDACRLAMSLRAMDPGHKWEIVSQVWVEILGYAAIHCRGAQHAQQLRKGGELLTHVWLLMSHLGITEQLQIAQGHARAKLNVK